MQRRRMLTLLSLPAIAATLSLAVAGPANAAEDVDAAGYVLVDPATAVDAGNGATFYPTGEVSDDTVVIILEPDGSLPGGLTEENLDSIGEDGFTLPAPVAARATSSYAATSAGWSGAYTGGSVIGINDSATAGYSFSVAAGSGQRNVGQGLGYYRGYNGSTFGTWSQWYNLGSADRFTPGGGSVPWGNVAATTKFRAQCATTTVCGGSFTS